jgi:hypothetical protein
VDLDARTLTIPRTKNGSRIMLPLNDDAMRALEIFRSRGDGNGLVMRFRNTAQLQQKLVRSSRARSGHPQFPVARLPPHVCLKIEAGWRIAREHRRTHGAQGTSDDEAVRPPGYGQPARGRFQDQ